MSDRNKKVIVNGEEKDVYTYYGKQFVLKDEVVKGGCQGCAFYNRYDCSNKNINRTSICNKQHKIFELYLKSLDE